MKSLLRKIRYIKYFVENFRGILSGIDVIKLIEKEFLSFINTGVVHERREGQVGISVVITPVEFFVKGFEYLSKFVKRTCC